MMRIQPFVNLIPYSFQKRIEGIIDSNTFPWFFTGSILTQREYDYGYEKDIPVWNKNEVVDSFGLFHVCVSDNKPNSDYAEVFYPILYFVQDRMGCEVKNLLRLRIRRTLLTPNTNETTYNTPHVDLVSDEPFFTFVYYVDESDGDTIFFDRVYKKDSLDSEKEPPKIIKKISHKKGDGVLFDGNIFHAGNTPQKYTKRTVINFDFTIR